MGSASTRKIEGFMALGGEVPHLNPHDIKIVGIDIKQTEENWFAFCPRAEEPLEPEWIDDIRRNGVRSPVDVWRNGDTATMLEGRRRVTAARIVWNEQEKKGVPVKDRIMVRVNVRKGDPLFLFGFNVGSENRKPRTLSQRAALMLQAQKYGADNDRIAELFSCTTKTVQNTMKVFDLAASVVKLVDSGDFPLREAIKLADKPREEQTAIVAKMVETGSLKGAKASNSIAAAKNGHADKIGTDTTRMRSKIFLEKWRDVLKKAKVQPDIEPSALLGFILGGPIPRGADDTFKETLVEAGYKPAKKGD